LTTTQRTDHAVHALLVQQLQRSLLANTPVVITVVIAAMWFIPAARDSKLPIIWGITVLMSLVARYVLIRRGHITVAAMMAGTLSTGVLWGFSPFFVPGLVPQNFAMFLALVIAGMAASALISLGAVTRVYWCFAGPSLLGVFVANMLIGGLGYAVAAVALAYVFTMAIYAPVIASTIRNSLRLGFENSDLVESLTRERNEARTQREQRTRFLAVASHDLRQPAHAIGLISSFLSELHLRAEPVESMRWQQGLSRLRYGIDGMNTLLDDLLDLSRLQLGATDAPKQTIALAALLQRLKARFQAEADNKNLRLRLRCAPELRVHSNSALLERMIGNLLANALRYTSNGGVLLLARRRRNAGAAFIELSVMDTGRGIAGADQTRIFEEFVRVGHEPRDMGAGLGLAIVSQAAQLLNHPLQLRSTLGRGSRFTICLGTAFDVGPGLKPDDSIIGAPNLSALARASGRALLLDDDPLILEALQALLSAQGWQVAAFCELSAALEEVYSFAPSVLILDVHLQNSVGGFEALAALRHELGEDIAGLILTGDDIEPLRGAAPPRTLLLRKPVQASLLMQALRELTTP
jgi:signal transduction histidine kinase/CheY-like chemotaxis protein